jgi:hypothetical protein
MLSSYLNSYSHAQVIHLSDNVTYSTVIQLECTCPTVQIDLTIVYILHCNAKLFLSHQKICSPILLDKSASYYIRKIRVKKFGQ